MTDQATAFMQGLSPPVPDVALWNWNTAGLVPTVSGFPTGQPGTFSPTKTGLTPQDLRNYVGVPLQYLGTPTTPVSDDTIIEWIRYAEDGIEVETSILLCQTWIASPPCATAIQKDSVGMITVNGGGQQIGIDYDLEDNAYDFMFPRAQDEGWMYLVLRYRPVQSMAFGVNINASTAGITAIKNTAYVYPLLNTFFRMPPGWNVEDKAYGLVRYVPAQNVQMLPLFAMQLAFMGFAENVPGAIWIQYTAGLTPLDYQAHYRFMRELVLAAAAITALGAVQGTINLGLAGSQIQVDGLMYKQEWNKNGAYGPLIANLEKRYLALLKMAQTKVSGPMIGSI